MNPESPKALKRRHESFTRDVTHYMSGKCGYCEISYKCCYLCWISLYTCCQSNFQEVSSEFWVWFSNCNYGKQNTLCALSY